MRIQRARVTPFALRLRAPLVTAHGCSEQRSGWLLELFADDGQTGLGEASPLAGFGLESLAEAGAALAVLARGVLGSDALRAGARGLDELLARAAAAAPAAPAARAALDSALHDLVARQAGCSVAAWLAARAGRKPVASLAVNAVVAGETPEAVACNARVALAQGFATFKLKLGSQSLAQDLARVRALREAIGAAAALRVDANGAWSEAIAERALRELAGSRVELVEQPVAAEDVAGLARLRARACVPVAADEAAAGEAEALRVLACGAADWLVIKPAAAGGLAAAARIAAAARRHAVGVFVTSFFDSAVGLQAALQLAASLPPELPACGLASGSLFIEDLARTPGPEAGRLRPAPGCGLGIELDPGALARLATGPALEIAA